MKFAKILIDIYEAEPFNNPKDSFVKVVECYPGKGVEEDDLVMMRGYVLKWFVEMFPSDFEIYETEPVHTFIARKSDGNWIEVTKNEEEAFRSLGKETKIIYGA